MRKVFPYFVIIFIFLSPFCVCFAQTDEPSSQNEEFTPAPDKCADSEFGFEFFCDPNWKWKRVKDTMMIIISTKPMVTCTIAKLDSPIKYLSQLTDDVLVKKQLYQDGFHTERVKFLDREAIHVKAMSRNFDNIRLSDYFFVRHQALYGILFSVYPSEEWENYKFAVKKILESFKEINP
jgi:hypothetical protein